MSQSQTPQDVIDLSQWHARTFVDLLRERADATPAETLYTWLLDGERQTRTLTYEQLDRRARAIAATLQRLARPGDRVLLFYADGLDYIEGLFGALYAGMIAVSGASQLGPRSLPRIFSILNDSSPTVILGPQAQLAEYQMQLRRDRSLASLKWLPTDTRAGNPAEWVDPKVVPDAVALFQYTSGSTGTPRGVMLTHRNLMHNLQAQVRAFGYRRGDIGVSWLPFSHDMGLIGALLMAVFAGGPCVLLSSLHFVEKPVRWLRAISTYGATLSGAPNFAYDWCVRRIPPDERAALDLRSWKIAFNGAESVRADTVRRFIDAFQDCGFRPEAMYPCYGLAEATLAVTGGTPAERPRIIAVKAPALAQSHVVVEPEHTNGRELPEKQIRLIACGRALGEQDVLIVSPDRVSLPAGEMGEIWVRGPSVALGYFNREAETREWFGGALRDGDGPFLRTGDLGFFHHGDLFVTGRLKDLIIIRGRNYYPQDLEQTAEASHDALRPGCAAAFAIEAGHEEALAIAIELENGREGDADAAIAAIRRAIMEQHDVRAQTVILLRAATLPKTPNGKLQRRDCRNAYQSGELVIVRESRQDAVAWQEAFAEQWRRRSGQPVEEFEDVRRWFLSKLESSGLDVAKCRADTPLSELGIDSVAVIQLKTELESAFGIRIQAADLINFADISSLANHVLEQVVRTRAGTGAAATTSPAAAPHADPAVAGVRHGSQRLQRQRARRAPGGAARDGAAAPERPEPGAIS